MNLRDLISRAAFRELESLSKGLDPGQAPNRLWDDPKRPKILAVDMDGTILDYDRGFHRGEYGSQIDGMVKELKILKANGWKIVIWTCRSDSPDLRKHLDKVGVPYDFVNNHPWNGPEEPRKIMADCYLDDRAISFDGKSSGLANKIINFKPWWERNDSTK